MPDGQFETQTMPVDTILFQFTGLSDQHLVKGASLSNLLVDRLS